MPDRQSWFAKLTASWFKARPEEKPVEDPDRLLAPGEEKKEEEPFDSSMGITTEDPYAWFEKEVGVSGERLKVYREMEELVEKIPEVASALDIYADYAATGGSTESKGGQYSVQIGDGKDSKTAYTDLISKVDNRTGLRDVTWPICRSLVLYGDNFIEGVVDAEGLQRLKQLAARTMIRNEDEFGRLQDPAFTQKAGSGDGVEFKAWQITHFRLQQGLSDKYGYEGAIPYSVRRAGKVLLLTEAALAIQRLSHGHNRLKHKVDTGMLEPMAALEFVNRYKGQQTKRRVIDPVTGEMRLENNPLRVEEDIYVAVGKDSPADVLPLGLQFNSSLEDIKYFQNKVFSGIKVPKSWVGLERDVNAKATLTGQAISFVKSTGRVRKALGNGYARLYEIAFLFGGFPNFNEKISILFPALGMEDELLRMQIELLRQKVALGWIGLGLDPTQVLLQLTGLDSGVFEAALKAAPQTAQLLANLEANKAFIPQKPAAGGGGSPPAESEDYERALDYLAKVEKMGPLAQEIRSALLMDPDVQEAVSDIRYLVRSLSESLEAKRGR